MRINKEPTNDYYFILSYWEDRWGSVDAKIMKGRCENCCLKVKHTDKVMYYADPDTGRVIWWHMGYCLRTNKVCNPADEKKSIIQTPPFKEWSKKSMKIRDI